MQCQAVLQDSPAKRSGEFWCGPAMRSVWTARDLSPLFPLPPKPSLS